MSKKKISRRKLLQTAAAGTGALGLSGMVPMGSLFVPPALAQTAAKNSHLMVIHLRGGYSASFGSAGAFLNQGFGGITGNNILELANGMAVHNSFASFPKFVLDRMATVGLFHGVTSHGEARAACHMDDSNISAPHILADAMGGPAANKLVLAGTEFAIRGQGNVNGTSIQRITDMQAAIEALGGGADSPYSPDRSLAAKGIAASMNQSSNHMTGNPKSLNSLVNGYQAAVDTLNTPAKPFNPQQMLSQFQVNGTEVQNNDMAAQLALAEVMFRADSNICMAQNNNVWDNHRDLAMTRVFNKMNQDIIPALKVFFERVYGDPDNNIAPQDAFVGKNVVTVILGDFCRTDPNSRHGTGVAATVIAPDLKNGSTGIVDAAGGMANNTPNNAAFWAFLATLVKAPANTVNQFVGMGGGDTLAGLNRHRALLR